MRSFVLAALLVALAGCETDLKSLAPFPCGKDKTCPDGFLCAADGCRPSGCGSGCAQLGSEYYCDQSEHECVSCVTSTSRCDSTGTPHCTTAGKLHCCPSDHPTFCDLGNNVLSGCWGSTLQCGDFLDCTATAAGKWYRCSATTSCAAAPTTTACKEVLACTRSAAVCDATDVKHCSKDGVAYCCEADHAAFCDLGGSALTGCWTTGTNCASFTDCTKHAAAGWYWCPTAETSCDAAATSCYKIANCSDGSSHYCTTVGKTYNCTTEKCS